MRSKITTAAIALALVGAFVAPASAAQAASATVSGTVEYRGAPVSGILVGWFKPSTGTYKVVTSGADGSYSLALPGSGQDYVLFGNLKMDKRAQSRGTTKYVGVYYGTGDTRDYAYQSLAPYTASGDADVVDIELAKPGTLVGADPDLTGFYELQNLGGYGVREAEILDNEGTLRFPNLVPGDYRILQDDYEQHATATDEILTVSEGETTTFDPAADIGGTIRGVATRSDGTPARDVGVRAVSADGEEFSSGRTDSKGRYTLKFLQRASWDVTFSYPTLGINRGYVPKTITVTGVTDGGTVTRDTHLSVGGRIRGSIASGSRYDILTLVGPDGTKVGQDDHFAYEGTFEFPSLASGKYVLYRTSYAGTKYGKKTITVKAGATADIGVLSRNLAGKTLTGKVSGITAGSAAARGSEVWVNAPGLPGKYVHVDNSGRYTLVGLPTGTYSLHTYAASREDTSRQVTVSGNTTKNVSVGKRWGTTRAAVTLAGYPAPDGDLLFTHDADFSRPYFGESVEDGNLVVRMPEDSYPTVSLPTYLDEFQANSPYWVSFPESALPFVITADTTRDVGTIDLEVRGSQLP